MPKPAPHEHPIHDLVRERWSPLAFDPARPVTPDQLRTLFEAARWAPSAFNEQPWRFLVGTRDGDPETYEKILRCLGESNQRWASTAPVLILSLARTAFTHNDKPNRHALFDTGQAIGFLLLQAVELGLQAHQMAGYDADKAREAFALPPEFDPVSVIALGYEGDPEILADEKQREKHRNPVRARRPLAQTVLSGASEGFAAPSPLLDGTSAVAP